MINIAKIYVRPLFSKSSSPYEFYILNSYSIFNTIILVSKLKKKKKINLNLY